MNDKKIGLIGLGNVGSKIANNILDGGFKLFIYDLELSIPKDKEDSVNLKFGTFCDPK